MRWMHRWGMTLRMLFGRGRAAAELDAELREHLERQIAENVAMGMDAQEARSAALRTFGNPALLRDQARATWSWSAAELLLRDVRLAGRSLRRSPGFTVIAVAVMALGIGANVALFTVVRNVLLKPFPFRDQQRLVALYENTSAEFPRNGIAPGMFARWRAENHSFQDLALLDEGETNLAGSGDALSEKLIDGECTANFFSVLGVRPALGRDFTAADDTRQAPGTVMLAWSLWQRRFGADPAIVNRQIRLNGIPYTVIGVLPAWFDYPDATVQLWIPLYHDKPEWYMQQLGNHQFGAIGRLKPGFTVEQGVADLSVIARRVHDEYRDNPFISAAAAGQPIMEDLVGDIRRPLYVLLAATGCVLLIACLNVANLLVARATAHRKELAIRMAMGGGRLRLIRERVMESALLAAAGGALGLLLALAAVRWLVHTRGDLARMDAVRIDPAVCAFTVGVVAVCAMVAGLLSSLGIDARLLQSLQDTARSTAGSARARLRSLLLVVEVGLTVVLLIGAGLLLKSYAKLRANDLGCITDNVLTMRLGVFGAKYNDPAQLTVFFRSLLERVRALPGVTAAGFVQAIPGQGYWGDSGFTIAEHPPLPAGVGLYAINRFADPGYFAALGIPILRGRSFDGAKQGKRADECVISDLFARKYFPNEDPLGKHLRIYNREFEIVGIVADTRYAIGKDPQPMQYFPLFSGIQNNGTLVIRSRSHVERLAIPVQRVVQQLDRDLAVSDVLTMNQLVGKSVLDTSFNATLLAGFAALSLLLAGVGLFGVLSYIVAQRTSEIGIRMALGAPREIILRRMLADGMKPALLGLALGLLGSAGLVRVLKEMLYETQPLDPLVFAGVAGMLLVVAAFACGLPAWRASRVEPMRALRME
jgi:predicted permease